MSERVTYGSASASWKAACPSAQVTQASKYGDNTYAVIYEFAVCRQPLNSKSKILEELEAVMYLKSLSCLED